MNVKLLNFVKRMSKIAIYAFIVCYSLSMAFAVESEAQRKMLNEISIHLDQQEVELIDLIKKIERSTNFVFAFSKSDVRGKFINLDIEQDWAMDKLLQEISVQGQLSFRRVNESINVREVKATSSLPDVIESVAEQQNVSGTITDETGESLPGATIQEKGTTNGTITDVDGNFALSVPEDAVLSVSFVGYETLEIPVNGRTIIDITLQADIAALQEVVVIGYGSIEKRDITGAVASFDEKALDRLPAANDITELMKAALPGLNVGTSTTASGSSSILVRGQTSLGATNSPLIVVDDVIFQGDLSSINPADVASVNVLKDASAAAVYGSRAAAGVIIITTKKGSIGKPTINIKSSVGASQAGVIQEMYGPDDILDYRRDIFIRENPGEPNGYYHDPNNLPSGVTLNDWLDYDGLAGTSTDPTDIWLGRLEMEEIEKENYKAGNSIDWTDLAFQTGLRTNNTISLSGRTDALSYYGSLGYVKNEGIMRYQSYEALRGRLNLEAAINESISVGVNLQASSQSDPGGTVPNLIGTGGTSIERQSVFGSLYYDDGSIKHNPNDDRLADNPLLYEYEDNYLKDREVFSNIYGRVELPFGFSYKVNWSNKLYMNQRYLFNPAIMTLGDGGDSGERREQSGNRWMVDNILNWNKTFGLHSFDFTFLYNVEEGNTWDSRGRNSLFSPNDKLSYHDLFIGSNPIINSNDTRYTADAMMGRLNYNFMDRYYLTMTIRRDGYSAFGQSNPRAVFPAASLAWRISDEPFLDNSDIIDNLKLRLSWGQNGNREIGIYSALARLGGTSYIYDQSTVIGVQPTDLPNQDLKWENTESYNIGLDFGIYNSRVSGTVDVYHMVTNDLLLERSLPDITGFESIYANLGEVQNRGFELALNSVNINTDDFYWNTTFSFWTNQNKITHLYGDMVDVLDENGNVIGQREDDDIANNWYIGHAIDEIFDYKIDGVWQLDEVDDALIYGREPGDFKIADINNDGIIDFDDKVFQGYSQPRYRLSFRNDFTYKNFDLSILMNSFLGYKGANIEHFNYRVQQQRLNKVKTPYWTPDNPTNEWARLSSKNSTPETTYYDNKSFFRIQNITLGYNFPTALLQKIDVQKLRIYANAQNFVAFSGWQYRWDVETSNPTPLIYTLGIDLSF
ncbi:MAG: SusC/RagA family TonB-linked outer membrane protein [Bacteroidota bacterium]